MSKVVDLFHQFKKNTDDVSAAILTLATILSGQQDKPLSVKQAAERRGVSVDIIYDLCKSGQLRHRRTGRKITINAADLDAT
jgi:excisionase family DNA binding protein